VSRGVKADASFLSDERNSGDLVHENGKSLSSILTPNSIMKCTYVKQQITGLMGALIFLPYMHRTCILRYHTTPRSYRPELSYMHDNISRHVSISFPDVSCSELRMFTHSLTVCRKIWLHFTAYMWRPSFNEFTLIACHSEFYQLQTFRCRFASI
jgi:hypothetical protein